MKDSNNGIKSCIVVTDNLFVNCYIRNDFPEIDIDGCEMLSESRNLSNWFNMRLLPENTIERNQMQSNLNCSNSLSSWLDDMENTDLLWYYYNEHDQPLNLDNPEIEIEIDAFEGRFGWSKKHIVIESETNNLTLFEGIMYDGKLKGKVHPKMVHHPAWRSRLLIGIYDTSVYPSDNRKKYENYIKGSFKNGKLHGLIQIFGKMTVDPIGHCSSVSFKGKVIELPGLR